MKLRPHTLFSLVAAAASSLVATPALARNFRVAEVHNKNYPTHLAIKHMALAKASKTTGVVLLLIGVSNMLRYQMAYLEIPDAIEAALLTATHTPWLMLQYINIIQVFLGTFLDMAAHILITTPLFLPLAIAMGVGPVQFGMMLRLNCALGLVHPPVGTVQFVGCAIGKISIGEATKTAWPYYLAIFIAITLVTYVPAFSTWLPTLITGHVVL